MARSSTRSLAGRTASAARAALTRTAKTASEVAAATTARGTAAKAPAKKVAKAPAEKVAKASVTKAAKAPAKKVAKAPATKTAKAPATKAAKAPATKTAKAPAKKVAKAPATKVAKAPATKVAKAPATKAAKAPATKAAKAPATKTAKKSSPPRSTPATSPRGLVVKAGEEKWTKAELRQVLDQLHEQREHSLEVLDAQSNELTGLMRDSGDGAGQDQADMGATSFERDHELAVLNNERDKLHQIERALARIDDGTYGVCESCGQPIGKMRLMHIARATLCMTCKQREERR